jgi:hypothetical protein
MKSVKYRIVTAVYDQIWNRIGSKTQIGSQVWWRIEIQIGRQICVQVKSQIRDQEDQS